MAKRVDWIKNLVLSLVNVSSAEKESDPAFHKNFKKMIQAVLESTQAAHQVIDSAQFDDGSDNPIEIPISVKTDLQLLEFVIQSKLYISEKETTH